MNLPEQAGLLFIRTDRLTGEEVKNRSMGKKPRAYRGDFRQNGKKSAGIKGRIEELPVPDAGEYRLKTGLVHVYTGEGKGKSSTAVGLAVRAAGAGLKVGFFQFFKNPFSSETKVLKKLMNLHFYAFASYYYSKEYFSADDIRKLRQDFGGIWEKVRSITGKNNYDVVILDEVMIALRDKLLTESKLLEFIGRRQKNTEVVLTGRYLPKKIMEAADIITEMKKIKHPFPEIGARKGIDF